jgi:hypothetical protein
MSQPTRIHSGHLTRRFSPAVCLLLLATFASRAFGQSTAATPPRAQSAVDARAHADKVDEYIEAEMRKQKTYQGHRVAGHGGDHLTGFTANSSRFIDDRLAVIVLTKLMPLDIGGITRRVAGFYVLALLPAKTGP